ncbi:MAG: DUF1285 domain-containing protein [Alphaproteobacteria bacterium]|nr:DUF1285 domain-containing protein [Alphaproteobacteria bacterium]
MARRLVVGKRRPVQQWNPEVSGEIDIRIGRDGTWYHDGAPIGRERMVALFASVLRHDDDGVYYLVTPVEKLAIRVDDAPFLAVEMTVHGAGREQVLVFRTNVDEEVMAGPEHPIRIVVDGVDDEPSPYIHVRDRLEALITRPVFYDLVELGVEAELDGTARLGVWSAGVFFPIARADALEDDEGDDGKGEDTGPP